MKCLTRISSRISHLDVSKSCCLYVFFCFSSFIQKMCWWWIHPRLALYPHRNVSGGKSTFLDRRCYRNMVNNVAYKTPFLFKSKQSPDKPKPAIIHLFIHSNDLHWVLSFIFDSFVSLCLSPCRTWTWFCILLLSIVFVCISLC